MIGTAVNVGGIVVGALAGLLRRKPLPASSQQFFKVALGVYTVWVGLRLAVLSLHGGAWDIARQLLTAVLAMILGRLLGKLLGIQRGLNHLGQMASARLTPAAPDSRLTTGDSFLATTVLYCAAPLAMLGPIPDGLMGDWRPLALKAVMDGLVACSLAPAFRGVVLLAALPMVALQVSITRVAYLVEPTLRTYSLMDSVTLVCGLMIFCVALMIFAIRKVELGNYLPSLAIAPVLSWLWR